MKKLAILITTLLFSFTLFSQTVVEAGQIFNEGNNQFKEKKYDEAIKSYKNALEICKELGEEGDDLKDQIIKMIPKAQLTHSKILIKEKKNDEAIVKLKETAKDAEEYNDARTVEVANTLLSRIYVIKASEASKEKNLEETVSLAEEAIKYDSATANAYLLKAVAYSQLKNDDGVYQSAMDIMKLKDDDKSLSTIEKTQQVAGNYFANQAKALIANNKHKEAIALFDKALSIDPTIEDSYYLKASCYNSLNQYDEAISTGLKGLEVESKNEDIRNGICLELARAYEAKGDNANACSYYKEAAKTAAFKAEATQKMNDVLKCN